MELTVNERVKLLRTSLAISQAELANAIGTTVTSISRIEKGHAEPRNSTVQKIAKTYNASLDWLLKGTGEMLLPGPQEIQNSNESVSWKDEAFAQLKNHNETLKQEIEWLKNLVNKMANVNFREGIGLVGIKNLVNTVSAVA